MRRFFLITALTVVLLVGVGAATAQSGTTIYIVAPGDTLARIAAYFNTTIWDIASLNGIYNVNYIYVGQQLIIPGAYTPPPITPPPPAPSPGGGYYIVQRGDTLARIARWYGTTIWALQTANGIPNPNLIYAGMALYIPPSSPPPPTYVIPYYVQYGDTVRRIADMYGVSIDAIVSYNNLWNPNYIYVGQLLYIPQWGGAAG